MIEIEKNARARVRSADGGDGWAEAGVDLFGDEYTVYVDSDDGSIRIEVNGEEVALSLEQSAALRAYLSEAVK